MERKIVPPGEPCGDAQERTATSAETSAAWIEQFESASRTCWDCGVDLTSGGHAAGCRYGPEDEVVDAAKERQVEIAFAMYEALRQIADLTPATQEVSLATTMGQIAIDAIAKAEGR